MKKSMLVCYLISLILSILSTQLYSQPFPDTNWVHVTYLDFHSDKSCPDFNPSQANNRAVKFMVNPYLDKDGLPATWSKVYFSSYIGNWFRSSEDGEQLVTDKRPTYNPQTGAFVSEQTVTENPYVNIKIKDSLPFLHIGNGTTTPLGTYEYQNKSFFPLDDKGFGKEPTWNASNSLQVKDHNYSFSMMLVDTFTYRKNLRFRFSGDDDVWVFINNRCVMDLGGIHSAVTDSFELDPMAPSLGLQMGQSYELKFFFCERQATRSEIWITSNIISIMPNQLRIRVFPNDTIAVGDTLLAVAKIATDTGDVSLSDLPGDITWGFTDLYANNHDSTFSWEKDSANFIPVDAHTTVRIWATYKDTVGIVLTDTVDIYVLPGPPDHLVIEASPDKPPMGDAGLWNDNPLDEVRIGENQLFNEQFFAILRDKEENWIGPASIIDVWKSSDISLITAEHGANPLLGQGRANRVSGVQTGSAKAIAYRDTLGKTLLDDIIVTLDMNRFPVRIESVVYKESDLRPDGYIDRINVFLDSNVEISTQSITELLSKVQLPAFRYFSFSESGFVDTDYGFSLDLVQDQNSAIALTAVTAEDRFEIVGNVNLNSKVTLYAGTYQIIDSLGPVIVNGIYCPSPIAGVSIKDTLIVNFSEDIVVPHHNRPFDFYDIDAKTNYSMALTSLSPNPGAVLSFLVEESDKKYPQSGDSLWIRAIASVKDNLNIIQDRDTKPAPLVVKPYPLSISIIVMNPINLSSSAINPNLINKYQLYNKKNGALIVIKFSGHIPNPETLFANLDIFDVVGNIVREGIGAHYVKGEKALAIVWDLRNQNRRKVGPAPYCGILRIGDGGILLKEEKVIIGVQ